MTRASALASVIKNFEGCKLQAYKDTGGVWTIGFGHTGPEVTPGMAVTYEQAVSYFEHDAAPLLALVADIGPVEAVYLASFGYNCGAGALKRLLAGELKVVEVAGVAKFCDRAGNKYGYTDAAKHVLPWLEMRRTQEASFILLARGNS